MGSKLFVEGLPPSFSSQELTDLFAPFGTVLSALVTRSGRTSQPVPGILIGKRGRSSYTLFPFIFFLGFILVHVRRKSHHQH
jgi:RNA recognition motif-containing protein